MIGAAECQVVLSKMATDEDPQNFILMYAVGANVSGQIASVIAGDDYYYHSSCNNRRKRGGNDDFQRRTFNTSF